MFATLDKVINIREHFSRARFNRSNNLWNLLGQLCYGILAGLFIEVLDICLILGRWRLLGGGIL
jgi:hypothetical protein